MATYAKPAKIPRWNDNLTNNIEPPEGTKDVGWDFEQIHPSTFENWRTNLVGQWVKWIDERFSDGSSADILLYNLDALAIGDEDFRLEHLTPGTTSTPEFIVSSQDDSFGFVRDDGTPGNRYYFWEIDGSEVFRLTKVGPVIPLDTFFSAGINVGGAADPGTGDGIFTGGISVGFDGVPVADRVQLANTNTYWASDGSEHTWGVGGNVRAAVTADGLEARGDTSSPARAALVIIGADSDPSDDELGSIQPRTDYLAHRIGDGDQYSSLFRMRKVITTPEEYNSVATHTVTDMSGTIPAGALSTSSMLRFEIVLSAANPGADSFAHTFLIEFGGTQVASIAWYPENSGSITDTVILRGHMSPSASGTLAVSVETLVFRQDEELGGASQHHGEITETASLNFGIANTLNFKLTLVGPGSPDYYATLGYLELA